MPSNKPILKKVACMIRQDNGVGFYRQVQPLRFLQREGLIETHAMTPFSGNQSYGEDKEAHLPLNDRIYKYVCNNADVMWSTHIVNYKDMLKMLDLRKHYNSKLILDIDDNLYAVSKDNPGEANSKALRKNLELCFSIADGLTVSVPALQQVYAHLNKNIFVNPNGLDYDLIDSIRDSAPRSKHKKIRIGWRGAYGHKADLESIYPVLKAIQQDYDVEYVFMGVSPKDGLTEPDFKVIWEPWTKLCDEDPEEKGKPIYPYYQKLAALDLDIAIVPLIDSSYNRCKSNLQVLEMSAMKYPVVCSPVENQKDMPLFYARSLYDWYEALKNLIESPKLRKEQANRQYDFARQYFNVKDIVHPLADWMHNLERRTDMEPR